MAQNTLTHLQSLLTKSPTAQTAFAKAETSSYDSVLYTCIGKFVLQLATTNNDGYKRAIDGLNVCFLCKSLTLQD